MGRCSAGAPILSTPPVGQRFTRGGPPSRARTDARRGPSAMPDSAPSAGRSSPSLHPSASSRACADRPEEHTSELQSLIRLSYAVVCLKKQHPSADNRLLLTVHVVTNQLVTHHLS